MRLCRKVVLLGGFPMNLVHSAAKPTLLSYAKGGPISWGSALDGRNADERTIG